MTKTFNHSSLSLASNHFCGTKYLHFTTRVFGHGAPRHSLVHSGSAVAKSIYPALYPPNLSPAERPFGRRHGAARPPEGHRSRVALESSPEFFAFLSATKISAKSQASGGRPWTLSLRRSPLLTTTTRSPLVSSRAPFL